MRINIRRELLKNRFGSEHKQIKENLGQLALEVYHQTLGDSARSLAELPRDWFCHIREIRVKVGSSWETLHFPHGVELPVPYQKRDGCFADISVRDPLGMRFREIESRKSVLKATEEQMCAEINAVLHSVTTVKRLLEEWPEIEPVVVKHCKVVATRLPAIRIDKLNESLRLNQLVTSEA